jgi:hypothetical protein
MLPVSRLRSRPALPPALAAEVAPLMTKRSSAARMASVEALPGDVEGLVAVLALAPVVAVLVAVDALADRLVLGEGDVVVRVDEAGRDDAVGAESSVASANSGRSRQSQPTQEMMPFGVDEHGAVLVDGVRAEDGAADQQALGAGLGDLAGALGGRDQRGVSQTMSSSIGGASPSVSLSDSSGAAVAGAAGGGVGAGGVAVVVVGDGRRTRGGRSVVPLVGVVRGGGTSPWLGVLVVGVGGRRRCRC